MWKLAKGDECKSLEVKFPDALLPCMKCDNCQNGNMPFCKHYVLLVLTAGSNADYVVIPEQNAVVFDPSISYEQGAMFEPSTVALHGVLTE